MSLSTFIFNYDFSRNLSEPPLAFRDLFRLTRTIKSSLIKLAKLNQLIKIIEIKLSKLNPFKTLDLIRLRIGVIALTLSLIDLIEA